MAPNPLSLKQRLAALSLSTSSPTSLDPPPLPSPKRRNLFTTPWGRRQHDPIMNEEQEAQGKVQQVMSRMIFQAGVDFESVTYSPLVL